MTSVTLSVLIGWPRTARWAWITGRQGESHESESVKYVHVCVCMCVSVCVVRVWVFNGLIGFIINVTAGRAHAISSKWKSQNEMILTVVLSQMCVSSSSPRSKLKMLVRKGRRHSRLSFFFNPIEICCRQLVCTWTEWKAALMAIPSSNYPNFLGSLCKIVFIIVHREESLTNKASSHQNNIFTLYGSPLIFHTS